MARHCSVFFEHSLFCPSRTTQLSLKRPVFEDWHTVHISKWPKHVPYSLLSSTVLLLQQHLESPSLTKYCPHQQTIVLPGVFKLSHLYNDFEYRRDGPDSPNAPQFRLKNHPQAEFLSRPRSNGSLRYSRTRV